jgi:hypothetical protein
MTSEPLACPDCTTDYALGDNYCRKCGMFLAALRALPIVAVKPEAPALVPRQRAGLPAPVRKAATALAVGTALQIGAGLAGKYLAAQSARHAVNPRGRRTAPVEVVPARAEPAADPLADTSELSETLLIRRVWIRRG